MLTTFDSRTFRNALGQFLTGVTVVTAKGKDGEPLGLTVNSFTSVSLEPPLVLFCIDKKIGSYEGVTQAAGFAVHILSEAQQDVSNLFATSKADKFGQTAYTEGLYGAPRLKEALAILECKTVHRYEGGDHTILVGQVERLEVADTMSPPLGYFRGRYVSLAPEAQE